MNTLFLGAASPDNKDEFLYSVEGNFSGEAEAILDVAEIDSSGKSPESVLAEFQRKAFYLTHVLECPAPKDSSVTAELIASKIQRTITRIKKSLVPKRVVLFSTGLLPHVAAFSTANCGLPIVLDGNTPFQLVSSEAQASAERLRTALQSAVIP